MGLPRKRKSEQKRWQIRNAAYQCFRDDGYHDTTVDAICQKAHSSKGSFYWHYSSKQEVFIDILDTWAREIMDELYEQFEEAVRQEDYITAISEALAREIHRGRVIIPLWLEFTLQSRHDDEIQQALAKFYRRARLAIVEILRPMLEDRVEEEEIRGVAATIFGAYTGLLVQDLSDPRRADATVMVNKAMNVLGWWFRQLDGHPDASPSARKKSKPDEKRHGAEGDLHSLLNQHPGSTELVHKLRAVVKRIAPDAAERTIYGWKQIAFETEGLFCYIKPLKQGARLGFNHGARLNDPSGLLRGRGKHQRFLDLTNTQSIPTKSIESLIQAALDLQKHAAEADPT